MIKKNKSDKEVVTNFLQNFSTILNKIKKVKLGRGTKYPYSKLKVGQSLSTTMTNKYYIKKYENIANNSAKRKGLNAQFEAYYRAGVIRIKRIK